MLDFPALIKQTRKTLGESQEVFGRRFKSGHANSVSRWESGIYEAPYEVLAFVVAFARDTVFMVCPNCKGTGRILTKIGEEVVGEKAEESNAI